MSWRRRKVYVAAAVKLNADEDLLATKALGPRPATPKASEQRIAEPASDARAHLRDPERYHIIGEHGRGGLGRVSRAHDRELGRDVAIKELISRDHVDEVRFLREALITARLEHPGIVPVHEAGRWPDGTPFYAMKLVSGRSLRDLIAECTTSDDRLGLLHHVIAIADAIAYAHGRRIIHRDLKPANVIVGEFGETIVIDWGLAKDLTTTQETPPASGPASISIDDELTIAGSVLGTPAYMAPEQRRGEHVDQRADVFAIGTMLWELCAADRVPPESADERHRMLRRAGIDRDLVIIINKALDPDPAHRYADASALAADLKAFKSGARIAARSYSPWAMLAHWTRRHRALALSATAALALAATIIVVSIRNIAAERDRADAALVSAQQERDRAQKERDRAQLSEASLLLANDPSRARDLLASLTLHTPQHAWLTSRAQQLAATRIVSSAARITDLFRAPGGTTIELRTRDGELYRLDPRTGSLETLDHDLTGAVTYRRGEWLYARKPFRSRAVQLSTPSTANLLDAGDLTSVSRLVALNDAVYALDASADLHRLDGKTSAVIEHGVHNIAGDGGILMVCGTNGDLKVVRDNAVVLRRRCPATKTPAAMAVVHDDYAALTSDGTLTAARRGRRLEIHTDILGEYELALSSRGVIAIADYSGSGKTWFVRPDGTGLEPGPAHASQPFSVATDGTLAAWGYSDGTVIVLDATTGKVWKFGGHRGAVALVVIDAANARVISAGGSELRVWAMKPPASSLVKSMPCSIYHVQLSPDGARAGLDCGDGSVWVWSRDTEAITQIHKHVGAGFATGVQWVKGMICSGGWGDGRVLCSKPDGTYTRTLDSGTSRITWLAATPDHETLIFASADGKIWRFDSSLQELYSHNGVPYRMAISPDGHLLASCALDGSFDVFDLVNRRLVSHVIIGSAGATYNVAWMNDALWTSGDDGTLKRWGLRDGMLTLRHTLQVPLAFRLMKVARGGWAASAGEGVLLASLDGASVALRLDLGRSIDALDVSPDLRYIAASVNGEIVVVDMQRNAIATLALDSSRVQQVSFLDATLLAFSEPAALNTIRVDRLEYVPFQAAPEL
jgi:serine/threonine protein kinase/WD40 repeat protein